MSKKKAIAILLFIFIGLFMFSYAEPGEGTIEKPVTDPVVEDQEVTKPVINNNYEKYPIVEDSFPAPIITVDSDIVVILLGQAYDVMTGVTVESKEDLDVITNITDTTKLEVGKHVITYEVKDSIGNEDSASRTIIVLEPDGDADNDGYTNKEELEGSKQPTDPSKPEGPENPLVDSEPTDPMDSESHPKTYEPTITLKGDNPYYMVVGGKYEEPGYEITVDEHDKETTEEDVKVTGEVDVNEEGSYELTYKITDKYENSASETRTVKVLTKDGDEDNDGFTNDEEIEEGTNPEDKEDYPEVKKPTITLKGDNPYYMIVGEKYEEPGYEITVDEHDKETTKEDVEITGEVDAQEVGQYELTYKVTDKYENSDSETRIVKVLTKDGDEDNDGFTNEEEIKEGTNPEDKEDYLSYQPNPTISIDSCEMEMTVYDEIPNLENCITVTDKFYGTEGVTFEVDTININKNQYGTYKVTVTARDNLNNETEEEFDFDVLKRDVTIIIDDKTSSYSDSIKEFTSNEDEVTVEGTDIGVTLDSNVTNTSNVGSYDITGIWSNENYNVTFVIGTYTIEPKTLEDLTEEEIEELLGVTFEDKTVTYDGEEHSVVITGTLPEGVEVTYENNTGIEVGEYEATVTLTGSGNYTGTATLEAILKITEKTLTEEDIDGFTFSGATVTYNGEVHSLSVTGLPEGFTVSYTNNNQIDAGTYTVIATISGTDNYSGTITKEATLVINKANVTITADSKQSIYGDALKELTYQVIGTVYSQNNVKDNLNVELTKEEGTEAGKYAITVTASNNNYNITINNAVYTISPKTLTNNDFANVKFEDDVVTYDGNAHNLVVTGLPEGFTATYNKENLVDAGIYEITATIKGNGNYSGEVTLQATLTINPKNVAVTWSNTTFEYDGNKHLPSASAEVEVVVNVKEGTDGIKAGTHTAVAVLKTSNKNYNLTNTEVNYTITSKNINDLTVEEIKDVLGLSLNDKTVTYNGEEQSLIVSGTVKEGITVDYNGTNIGTNVGTYPVTATITGTGNYSGTATLNATLTINKAAISLKAEDKEITYGEPSKELTYIITNGEKFGDDNLNIVLTREDATNNNAGKYAITITASNDNYDISLTNGIYTIKKAIPKYTVPTGLIGYEDVTLSEIELPDGFTYQGDIATPLTVPKEDEEKIYTVKVTYTPEDTTNYEIVSDIEVEVVIKAKYYTITFVDKDNKVIGTPQSIRKGGSAVEPPIAEEYEEKGKMYVFSGWVGTYTNVTSDATITPLYIEESTSTTFAYLLKPKYFMPTDGDGYWSLFNDYYEDALVDDDGKRIPLSIKVSGLTEEQARAIANRQTTVVALGEENVMKYLTQSTKDQLAAVSKGTEIVDGKEFTYTVVWYVLKYQPDGWHLDGHKIYDETTLDISATRNILNMTFNNAVTNLSVTIDGESQTVTNSNQAWIGTTKIGNEYYASIDHSNTERTVVVKYTVNGKEYTKEYTLKGTTLTEK